MNTTVAPGAGPALGRLLPIDRLRAFLTALVVTHHAVLAYHPYAPAPPERLEPGTMAWAAFPVVDSARWPGIDALVSFNDSFFMALMFLLAGLFVPAGIKRRGPAGYVRERALRLGLPFLLAAGVLAPLAYAATYGQITAAPSLADFAAQWLALGVWPAGPAWFLWVLFAFGAVAVVLTRWMPQWNQWLARGLFGDGTRPWRALLGFGTAAILVYVPTAAVVDPMSWGSLGPFFVQTARLPLYLLYFLAGAALSTQRNVPQGLLDPEGRLARRWFVWANAAPLVFVGLIVVFLVLLSVLQEGGDVTALKLACGALFALSGVVTSFALLAAFLRKTRSPQRGLDSFAASAFGIYLLHYPVVTWSQFALLPVPLPGYAKGLLVIVTALGLSWLATAALRRIAAVDRVIGPGAAARRA